ncbi:hypothetical protein ACQPZF_36310 [Actinosynnema sp. CS-041913]|uniref:hypothetical protein n=1 Tax=Actinosynnema sp. CS-041913 TaxID=3239917 RepID=UPI003D8B7E62
MTTADQEDTTRNSDHAVNWYVTASAPPRFAIVRYVRQDLPGTGVPRGVPEVVAWGTQYPSQVVLAMDDGASTYVTSDATSALAAIGRMENTEVHLHPVNPDHHTKPLAASDFLGEAPAVWTPTTSTTK